MLEAEQLELLARDARQQARNYQLAGRTEASVGGRLTSLQTLGWNVLADRRWPGSARANVDFLLVGPGGVLVVDVKAWRDLRLVNGSVFCEDECRDDELDKLVALTTRVQESLLGTGLTPQALRSVMVFAGRDLVARVGAVDLVGEANVASWAMRLGRRLNASEVDRLTRELEGHFPPYQARLPQHVAVAPPRTVLPREFPADDTLFDIDDLTDSILEAALAKPIEDWMTFLHPDQAKLVSGNWSGPARIRGPAGTGKTVVGLHRAAYLARRSAKPVLFVTFVRTLPVVLGALCERLAPEARPRITFTGLHQLAVGLLRDAGTTVRLDAKRVDTAYARAWMTVGRQACLTALDERPTYWREEIDHVIKGRGLTAFEQYADLARIGRRTPMRSSHQEAMWDLYVEYERHLRQVGCHDFNDLLIMAGDLVGSGRMDPGYGSVIVDEVQDLNLVGLKLLKSIAGDGPDRFLMLGDGQQAVYPGGFTLAEAGIGVTGRATVLRVNYRNTAAILEHAAQVVGDESFDDLDDAPVDARRDVAVRRKGGSMSPAMSMGPR